MEQLARIPDFKDEREIIAFMEEHDGFELVDQGLAEIVETPPFHRKSQVVLDPETRRLVDELVAAGICADGQEAIAKAMHVYALAVLPQSYALARAN